MTTPTSSQRDVTLQQLIDNDSTIRKSSTNNDSNELQQQLSAMIQTSVNLTATTAPVASIPFQQLRLDSRQVAAKDVFVLLKSQSQNCQRSREYLVQAAQKAAFILSEIDPVALFVPANIPPHANLQINNPQIDNSQSSDTQTAPKQLAALPCPVLFVPNIRDFLGDLVQAYLQYQQPVALPTVVAVTGTNGKTTISQLVAQLTQLAAMSSAVMGTAGNGKLGALIQASHTTSDALAVQQFLYQIGTAEAKILALEASSHGLDQQRLQGMPVTIAIYTNLSRDHLDYHADMSDYVDAKAKLFDKAHFPTLTHAIINIDDKYAQVMLDTAHASGLIVWTYSLQASKDATFVAATISPSLQGVEITLRSQVDAAEFNSTEKDNKQLDEIKIISPLLGRFNVANLLAAIAAVVALGISLERIASLVPQLQGAVGRMQRVPSNDSCFIVDYAHTPDALSQVLASLKTHCQGQLWAVFGCGGDRDGGKRPLMAQAGLSGADRVVLTADNPRTEDPNVILQDMQVGMSAEQYQRTHIEPARQKAIEYAVSNASADDIVVIAGKGHETYQEINGVRHDFDDSVILQKALQ
ncbi:UDP-N-acetylmuramoyl-L-alanyl-D-glutamate--2,6-diaminopimelate ligase [Psychrobacter frigidicola]|uniref:UDP-N-acetylmuramoyl-L-alanyl-D-glutamate--2, 6-diaminopimelate ligase n=1 Tax=Psychrobacter frigidicola TaxID=45611 RepID=UPI001919ED97|nr:UDP-N-acetylmuramoyl-L-alanyl-D-glutamate--2,6-diaminopimelate ligase [Psychrobacter frigidicola]